MVFCPYRSSPNPGFPLRNVHAKAAPPIFYSPRAQLQLFFYGQVMTIPFRILKRALARFFFLLPPEKLEGRFPLRFGEDRRGKQKHNFMYWSALCDRLFWECVHLSQSYLEKSGSLLQTHLRCVQQRSRVTMKIPLRSSPKIHIKSQKRSNRSLNQSFGAIVLRMCIPNGSLRIL